MRIMLEKSDRRVPEPASPIAPDCRGTNFYEIDAGLKQLLDLYVEPALRDHLEPHFERLGGLAGGRLDELAAIADKHPPRLHPGDREMERIGFGDFQFHAMSHRGVLGLDRPLPPVAKYVFQYLFVQAEFGLMCPISVTDTSIHLIRKFGGEDLKTLLLPRMLAAELDALWKGSQFITEKTG